MKDEIQDMSLRYNGRVVKLEIYVNSDEDPNTIATRCLRASRGVKRNAATCMVGVLEGDTGREAWSVLQQMSTMVAADPSTTFDVEKRGRK